MREGSTIHEAVKNFLLEVEQARDTMNCLEAAQVGLCDLGTLTLGDEEGGDLVGLPEVVVKW